jgi:hypothetical protein
LVDNIGELLMYASVACLTTFSGCLIVLKQPCPFVQIFDLGIKGYTAAQSAGLKMVLPAF